MCELSFCNQSKGPWQICGLAAGDSPSETVEWVKSGDVRETEEVLGEGTFAVVSKGSKWDRRERLNKPVAWKELKPSIAAKEHQKCLFLYEAILLSKLRHRHIVRHEGFGSSSCTKGTRVFQLQEYVAGGTLQQFLRRSSASAPKRQYPLRAALRLAIQIAKAVEYIHAKPLRIMHRDLKSGNILLTENDISSADAKIADFGLAVQLGHDSPRTQCLFGGEQASAHFLWGDDDPADDKDDGSGHRYHMTSKTGSYMYMAPEVFSGLGYNEKADIYSLGVIVAELVTGSLMSDAVLEVRTYEHAKKFARFVSKGFRLTCPKSFPDELRHLLHACWDQDFRKRPSATEIVYGLEAFYSSCEESAPLLVPLGRVTAMQKLAVACQDVERALAKRIPFFSARRIREKSSFSLTNMPWVKCCRNT